MRVSQGLDLRSDRNNLSAESTWSKDTQQEMSQATHSLTHTCDGLFICQLYSLPGLLEETDCKEDTPLTLPFCIIRFLFTVDNSDMN
jgi:hypothetical protein